MAESSQIKQVRKPWQEALAEYFILYPERSMGEAAQHFGVTIAWLSVVKNSDAFQDYYQARRREHTELLSRELVDAKIDDKLEALAEMSIDAITARVEEHVRKVPTRELSLEALHDSANLALKALGFGGKAQVNVNTGGGNAHVLIEDAQALARARGNLRVVRELKIDPQIQQEQSQKELNFARTTNEGVELLPEPRGDKAAA